MVATLRTMDGHASEYRIPLTDEQQVGAKQLQNSLRRNKDIKATLHYFLYIMTASSSVKSFHDMWDCPWACYMAAWAAKPDGNFVAAEEYTRILAKWKYIIRNCAMIESSRISEDCGGLIK